MKSSRSKVALTLTLLLAAASALHAADGKPLFNGKNLDGWRGDPNVWSVEDGAIVGRNTAEAPIKHNTFLIHEDEVGDFELTFKYKLVGGNSGLQYRSKVMDAEKFIVGGYQADFEAGPTYSGILYEERGRGILAKRGEKVTIGKDGKKTVENFADTNELQKHIKSEDWNEYRVVANGPVLQHFINGHKTAEVIDHEDGKRSEKGVLALQVHAGPPMTLYVKDMVIKPAAAAAAPGARNDAKPTAAAGATSAKPHWVWLAQPGANETVYLRRTFTVKGNVKSAKLAGSADNDMTVFVNGKKALANDNWGNVKAADVTKLLKTGDNVIAVEAKNSDGPAGVGLMLSVDTGASEPLIVATDGTWKIAHQADGGKGNAWRAPAFDDTRWASATDLGEVGAAGLPWTRDVTLASYQAADPNQPGPSATDPAKLSVKEGFKVELLYSVPREAEGSWVAMCVGPKGTLYVSDQYGKLYHVTIKGNDVTVDALDVSVGGAQGMCWAFDSLYIVVAHGKQGLYRIRDTNNDGQPDEAALLREFKGGGEHGPHAVILSPDGRGLYVLGGNHTEIPDPEKSLVPRVWAEDQLLPRLWDANGHAVGKVAPAGWIARTDPEGKAFELVSIGFRNQYDMAFNRHGDLFTYDADMEWDIGLPWYRPTRVNHAVSGSEFGWRGGTGKFPDYYADNLPAVVNVGPGSPTGVTFGYGAKFPARYQEALFINDWSYGKLYAVHLTPRGATYTGQLEEFITGSPLPLTDIVINPADGAMYFAIGGRRTQSGLYRVTYTGDASTRQATMDALPNEAVTRRNLERFHGKQDAKAIAAAWPHLSSNDRFVRWAARTALEWQPTEQWANKALGEKNPQALIEAMIGLARTGDKALAPKIVNALSHIDWTGLAHEQKLALVRAYQLTFARMGEPADAVKKAVLTHVDAHYPAQTSELNRELAALLIYLEAPGATERTMKLLTGSPTQQDQIHFALVLREADTGWTMPLREEYFGWFQAAKGYKGGNSFQKFLVNISNDAVKKLSEGDKQALAAVLEGKAKPAATVVHDPDRQFRKAYTVDDVAALAEGELSGRDFANGRKMFGIGACFQCHRFAGEGGSVGPDLTGLGGRFSVRDIAEAIVDPSKVISDQYEMTMFTMNDGNVIVGRIANLNGDNLMVATNMFDPGNFTNVNATKVKSTQPSPVSPMPPGLINMMTEDEIRDLFAYMMSGGDPDHKMFKK